MKINNYLKILICVCAAMVMMVAAGSFAFGSEHEQITLEGILGGYSLYHNNDMTSYAYRNPSNAAKVLAVCSVGDRCRIRGATSVTARGAEYFHRIDSVTRVAAAPKEPVNMSGVLTTNRNGYWFVAFEQYDAEVAVIGSAGPAARQIGAVCADGDICRLKGMGSRDPEDGWIMPSELHQVELVRRARLVTVEMTGAYSGGSMGNFDIVGDEEGQFLDGLELFAHTPVGRTMPSCERYRVVALVRDTDPHRVVDLLAVGCARPDQGDIPAAVEGGPQ